MLDWIGYNPTTLLTSTALALVTVGLLMHWAWGGFR